MTVPAPRVAGAENDERCLPWLTALPGVSPLLDVVTTLGMGRVTRLLESAAYFPLWFAGSVGRWSSADGGLLRADGPVRRMGLVSRQATGGQGLVARNNLAGNVARLRSSWGLIPDDFEACPGAAPPVRPPFNSRLSQRFELEEFDLDFAGLHGNGLRAHGTGTTLPSPRGGDGSVGVALVLDVVAGRGELTGLAGTVVASGRLDPGGHLRLQLLVRMMDPSGHLRTSAPAAPVVSLATSHATPALEPVPSGRTYLAFLGEVDLDHRVTLRCSSTRGLLGSNVYERLRLVDLGFTRAPCGWRDLAAWSSAGAVAGSVAAKLNFNPLSISPVSPISTDHGVFEFTHPTGGALGTLHADMREGRSMRTALPGEILPAFRFGGFGAITGGSGYFAGASGIMTMNSVVSVQPRTLSNLYLLGLDDPEGRYRDRWAA